MEKKKAILRVLDSLLLMLLLGASGLAVVGVNTGRLGTSGIAGDCVDHCTPSVHWLDVLAQRPPGSGTE